MAQSNWMQNFMTESGKNGPCNGCMVRNTPDCRRTCAVWSAHEENKRARYAKNVARIENSEATSAQKRRARRRELDKKDGRL